MSYWNPITITILVLFSGVSVFTFILWIKVRKNKKEAEEIKRRAFK